MRINIFYISLLFFTSCSSLPPNTIVRKIEAEDLTQAKNVVTNHVQFLKTLFIQTRDPYYNVLKWSDECLSENSIGEILEKDNSLVSKSVLFMKNNEPGYCSNNLDAIKTHLIYKYCDQQKAVLELKIHDEEIGDFELEKVCD